MISFLIGLLVGGFLGVAIMAILSIGRESDSAIGENKNDEKTVELNTLSKEEIYKILSTAPLKIDFKTDRVFGTLKMYDKEYTVYLAKEENEVIAVRDSDRPSKLGIIRQWTLVQENIDFDFNIIYKPEV